MQLHSQHHIAPILPEQLDAAKQAVGKQFNQSDFDAAELAVNMALIGLGNPLLQAERGLSVLRERLRACNNLTGERAMQLLDNAHASNKTSGLSDVEQLLFVVVKSTKVIHFAHQTNPHKLLFTLLSGRSMTWWDNNHTRMLLTIAKHV
jgi:hypothetical protein